MKSIARTIISPVITEKSMTKASGSWFTFKVSQAARKNTVAAEIKRLYNVKVLEVRMFNVAGKTRRVGRMGKTVTKSDWKKAMVKLPAGQRIPVFEVTQESVQK